MPPVFEVHRDHFTISTAPDRLNVDAIADMLARAYWAQGRTRETIERSLAGSLVFGLYHEESQIGLARVVSDYATFAWLCDVFIHEDYRGQGYGKWLIETVVAYPGLQGLRRFLLATRDAQGLYRQFGWSPLQSPERWMELLHPPQ